MAGCNAISVWRAKVSRSPAPGRTGLTYGLTTGRLNRKTARIARAFRPRDFSFDFTFSATQPPLLQGNGGLSRKGPRPESASYYYSLPQLKVHGTLTRGGKAEPAVGTAWLDHEWSSSYMDERAVGWDWIGINFADGGALMAFRMRDQQGGKFWAGGAYRAADGGTRIFEPGELDFSAAAPLAFFAQ